MQDDDSIQFVGLHCNRIGGDSDRSFDLAVSRIRECERDVCLHIDHWPRYHREVFGKGGIIDRVLTVDEVKRFSDHDDFARLHATLADIRSRDSSKASADQPQRMLTIRVPASLHDCLSREAIEANTSLNKLAITKLLLPADDRFIPETRGQLRGRRLSVVDEDDD